MIFGFNTDVRYADTVYHVQSEARQHELLLQTQVFVKGRCIGKHATSYAEKTKEPGFSEEHMHEMLKDQHKYFVTAVRQGRIEAELAEVEDNELKAAVAAFAEPAPPVAAAAPVAVEVAAPPPPAPPVPAPALPATAAPASSILEVPLDIAAAAPPMDDLAAQFAAAVAEKPVDPGVSLTPAGAVLGKGLSLECSPPQPSPDGSAVTIPVKIADDSGPAAAAQVSVRISASQGPATYVYAQSGPDGIAAVVVSLNGLDLSGTALLIQASYRGKSASRKFSLGRS